MLVQTILPLEATLRVRLIASPSLSSAIQLGFSLWTDYKRAYLENE
jgi:hypothetical protein